MHGVTPDTGGFKPMLWTAKEDTFDCFCMCKATKDPPFCDGSHKSVGEGLGADVIPVAFQKWDVLSTASVSHDTKLLRLKCQEQLVDAHVSFHFSLRAAVADGSLKYRPYTPVRFDAASQEMDLVVKRYDTGLVSPIIHGLKEGDSVELRGPIPGEYSLKRDAGKHKNIALFAGGTGITPILQIAEAVATLPQVPTIHLFCCNKSDADILCKDEIDELGRHTHVQNAFHVIEAKSTLANSFEGRMSADILQKTLAAPDSDSHAIVCGPPLFNRAVRGLLEAHGYAADQITVC